jgi:hypothetical protein
MFGIMSTLRNLVKAAKLAPNIEKVVFALIDKDEEFIQVEGELIEITPEAGSNFIWTPSDSGVNELRFSGFGERTISGKLIIRNNFTNPDITIPDNVVFNNSVDIVDPEAPLLSISDIVNRNVTTSTDHNLAIDDFVQILGAIGAGIDLEDGIFQVTSIISPTVFEIVQEAGGTYTSGATAQKSKRVFYTDVTRNITIYDYIIVDGQAYITLKAV